jgi:hypothetical protein
VVQWSFAGAKAQVHFCGICGTTKVMPCYSARPPKHLFVQTAHEPEKHPSGAKGHADFDCIRGTAEAVPFQNQAAIGVFQ